MVLWGVVCVPGFRGSLGRFGGRGRGGIVCVGFLVGVCLLGCSV